MMLVAEAKVSAPVVIKKLKTVGLVNLVLVFCFSVGFMY